MSLLVLGLSHHGAPMELLESAVLDQAARGRLEAAITSSEHVVEAVVVSTCNRTEVYAEGLTFHGALADVSEALAGATSVALTDLQPHLYVHYEDRGIAHAFSVAAGLDSMAVGEAQILGQLRDSLTRAQRRGHVGPALNTLLQQALRVGKRVHTETEIDDVSRSLVGAGLAAAAQIVAAHQPEVGADDHGADAEHAERVVRRLRPGCVDAEPVEPVAEIADGLVVVEGGLPDPALRAHAAHDEPAVIEEPDGGMAPAHRKNFSRGSSRSERLFRLPWSLSSWTLVR